MDAATAGLWIAVVGSGLYHGINPGMGWPLAVSAALMDRKNSSLFSSLTALSAGHFVAIAGILLPFALMAALVAWQVQIRLAASLLVIGFGVFLLIYRRHPRFLARIPPSRLALWSFLVAIAHGAGLMLVPIYLGLCRSEDLDAGHQAATTLMGGNLTMAILVAFVHTLAMIGAGGVIAFAVHRWLGMKVLTKTWFNLDTVWALSLVVVGAIGLAGAMSGPV